MPFNSETYHRNKHRKLRIRDMNAAREAKARLKAASPDEALVRDLASTRLRQCVMSARMNNRLYLMYRRFGRMS